MKEKTINRASPDLKTIRIAILSSFTLNGIEKVLTVQCANAGIKSEITVGPYNQAFQQIVDSDSALYQFKPKLIILILDIRTLLGKLFLDPYSVSDKERRDWIENEKEKILEMLESIKKHSSAKVLLHTLERPSHSPLGFLESKQSFGLLEAVDRLNDGLRQALKGDATVFLFDYNLFLSKTGQNTVFDPKMYYLGDVQISFSSLPVLCSSYLSFIKSLCGLNRKCLVLDLDNTLWGGVLGEVGIEGIQLGPTPEGRLFYEIQSVILSLHRRGIVLAINSKNNKEDALQAIRKHPHMLLRENHFSSVRINWEDKVANMKAIAEELNIGLDSLVFVDDDQFNREWVKRNLPMVHTLELPPDSARYVETLAQCDVFHVLSLTEEDLKKGKMYEQQKKRADAKKKIGNLDDYLKEIGMKVTIEPPSPLSVSRIAQLTQKTNQFNLTTKRYQREEIEKLSSDANCLMYTARVEDKFGDNGMTGLTIVIKEGKKWIIDTFLLSCRVIGRRVEETLIYTVLEEARRFNVEEIQGSFRATDRNGLCRDFYKKMGFQLNKEDTGADVWAYNPTKAFPKPKSIKIQMGLLK